MTTCILHNFRRSGDVEGLHLRGVSDETADDGGAPGPGHIGPNNYPRSADRIRREFMRYFMTTGAVVSQ